MFFIEFYSLFIFDAHMQRSVAVTNTAFIEKYGKVYI